MNTTGCADNFARDDFFVTETPAGPCIVPIPLYAILMVVFTLLLTAVAISRTRYIMQRSNARTRVSSDCSGRFGWLQILTITQSWLSAINSLLILVIPLTFGTGGNVMTCLLGIQYTLYTISAERWQTKLIRLGSRIIGPRARSAGANNNGKQQDRNSSHQGRARIETSDNAEQDDESMNELRRFDRTLVLLMTSIRAMILFIFVSMCIVSMVLPKEGQWLRAGIGLQGYQIFSMLCVSIYQYQRCKNAIILTQKRVEDLNKDGERMKLQGVLKKFTRHQLILSMFGIIGSLIHVLWAVGAVPITFATILVAVFLDAMVNGSMFFTFVLKTTSRKLNKSHQQSVKGPEDPPNRATLSLTKTMVSASGVVEREGN